MDPDTFRPHDKRVSYALSYLCGSTQCHFDAQLEDEEDADFMPPDWLHDWTRFVVELRDMFGDLNAEATAEADLNGLRMQTSQKFADFLVEFNTLSSQVNWGDRALRHRLKHALPDRIKDLLMLVEESEAFNDWKRLIQNIDQRYWERQAEFIRIPKTVRVIIPIMEPFPLACVIPHQECLLRLPARPPAIPSATRLSPATSPHKVD